MRTEVELQFTPVASDIDVGVLELVCPVLKPLGVRRRLKLALEVEATLVDPSDLKEWTEAETSTNTPVGSIAEVELLVPVRVTNDRCCGEAYILDLSQSLATDPRKERRRKY